MKSANYKDLDQTEPYNVDKKFFLNLTTYKKL
jgi:hypothetical protein